MSYSRNLGDAQPTGLFKSIYGKPQEGIFTSGFSNAGAGALSKSSDIRLGDDAATTAAPIYMTQVAGMPLWVYGVFALGFLLGRRP